MFINTVKLTTEKQGQFSLKLSLYKLCMPLTILFLNICGSFLLYGLLTAEKSHDLIMTTGGAQLLAKMVSKTDDPQTLRMVAGALDNLCGNGDKIYKFWFQ